MERRRKDLSQEPWNAVPRRRASDWLMHKLRVPVAIASVICTLTYADAGYATTASLKKPISSRKLGLSIRVEGDGWGATRKEKIETVLYAVADELMARLPKKLAVPIVVTHTNSNPVALYERGENGEYLVRLHAKDENWHLYVYEFAHELCHILSNYEENAGIDNDRYNQWFEETLCETASLFTLKNLAATWKSSPPSPEWAQHADKLHRFFELLISEGHRRLPAHTPLVSWLRDNETHLRNDPYLRDKNELVAILLLPLFEKHPDKWDALGYLNLDPDDARNSLRDYLNAWYRNAPPEHKAFVTSVLSMFQLGEVAPAVAAAPADETTHRVAAADTKQP